ncbi:MAG TPA: hypothetical protein VFA00_13055 [Actinomycetota bacterium]|jgi:hypothetical protein|nr:hypothetical protein [Actinomycetota bacterium]
MTHEIKPNEDLWAQLGPAEMIKASPLPDEEMGVEEIEDLVVDEDAELADVVEG